MIEEIRKYIGTCPFLKGNKINVNYLGESPAAYSIDSVPATPVIKQYADGGQLCQQLFVLASRELYTRSALSNIAVARFYEDFACWIDENNRAGALPELPDGLKAQTVEVLTGQYLYDFSETDARYQIQCRLIYYKEAQPRKEN